TWFVGGGGAPTPGTPPLAPPPPPAPPNMLASAPTEAAHRSPSARLTAPFNSSDTTTLPSSFWSSPVRVLSDRVRITSLSDAKYSPPPAFVLKYFLPLAVASVPPAAALTLALSAADLSLTTTTSAGTPLPPPFFP